MPSTISSFAEFDRRLGDAMKGIDALAAQYPEERAIQSIKLQLEALHGWTRGGRKPEQVEKDRLNFGLLASRFVDEIDSKLAGELYQLASYVIYW
ncbi:immunity protein Tsi6 family protein [Polyangium aurulentum]|uniref:immunity protein Tsi6 family protein n=1 Tax=Polyangium aurulentum TaxID=2567896 RepID=UPI0010ADA6EB|nr:immunity protein Tsi6 family protein [Polyangium aurulentum]UQA62012.1 hypothetical protein E8A73_016670 [Polyangium aurulentum]